MKVLEVKGVRVGEGRPKTIVSLMERDVTGLLAKADETFRSGVSLAMRAARVWIVHVPVLSVMSRTDRKF